MILALYLLLGAFINRVRGGFLPTGHTQLARAIYGTAFAAMLFLHTWEWQMAMAFAPAMFLGAILGSNDWGLLRDWSEAREGFYSGVVNIVLPAIVVGAFGHTAGTAAMVAAGLLKLPLYYLAVKVIRSPIKHLAGGELGEALYGAALGAAVVFV